VSNYIQECFHMWTKCNFTAGLETVVPTPRWDSTLVQRGDCGRTGWRSKCFVESRCTCTQIKVTWPCSDLWPLTSTPEMSASSLFHWLSCCIADGRVGCHTGGTSAVQRTLLDGFSHHGAQQSDDGARVLAAHDGAARHDHVGSCLRQKWAEIYFFFKPTQKWTGIPGETCGRIPYLGTLVNRVRSDSSVYFNV